VESLRAQGIETPVLVISAYELPHLHDTLRHAGANDLVQKPFDQEELIRRMARLLAA
jgi:CheY-like chemotaxis protein